ncbi:hypothetical protein [Methanoplanus limicola]|uniref:Uncharacterized protein n=1 Tax=Methanoplanus limicola DSM 2279 TaxID=937775 RepID=H1Z087_9EURY|nr:hypothetical protein [Methanoplanus limicola]EHQ36179.1 hypothetical protein Metlim_2097 [Methanoplanus limicola DSM 2279]
MDSTKSISKKSPVNPLKEDNKGKYVCTPIDESEKKRLIAKMSSASFQIFNTTKWSENGFVPSFKITDEILMRAAKKTYKKSEFSDR